MFWIYQEGSKNILVDYEHISKGETATENKKVSDSERTGKQGEKGANPLLTLHKSSNQFGHWYRLGKIAKPPNSSWRRVLMMNWNQWIWYWFIIKTRVKTFDSKFWCGAVLRNVCITQCSKNFGSLHCRIVFRNIICQSLTSESRFLARQQPMISNILWCTIADDQTRKLQWHHDFWRKNSTTKLNH